MPGRSFLASSERTKELFTGKERDDETGWYHIVARRYHPAIGRWLSVDPVMGKYPSLSPYNYVASNPIVFLDPDGRGIERNGKLISTKKALNLTYEAIRKTIGGEKARIDFRGTTSLAGVLRDIQEGFTSVFSGDPTHSHSGLSAFQVFFGDNLRVFKGFRESKHFRLYVNTEWAAYDLHFDKGATKLGISSTGDPIVGMTFYTKNAGQRKEVIHYADTFENVQNFLKDIGKRLEVSFEQRRTETRDGQEREYTETIYRIIDIDDEK